MKSDLERDGIEHGWFTGGAIILLNGSNKTRRGAVYDTVCGSVRERSGSRRCLMEESCFGCADVIAGRWQTVRTQQNAERSNMAIELR